MPILEGASDVTISGNPAFIDIQGNVTIIRYGDEQFTEIQRQLICDYMANLTALPDINNNLKKHFLTQSIITLPRVQAAHNDYETKKTSGPCFKGTREALLRELADWMISQEKPHIYVLSGLAGIGKSTVAYTIATKADNLRLLGASFFFSRGDTDRKNAKKFFTTIAHQFCTYNEEFAQAIGNALLTQRGSAAITKGPYEQLKALIVEPLQNLVQSRNQPVLIVVDALDECEEDDAHSILMALRQLVQLLPSFRVILTTRPQPHLDQFFDSQEGHRIFRLQDIEDKVVDSDIRLYLKHSLSQEQVKARLQTSGEQWLASDDEIELLVGAVGRLFIVASTAVRFILNPKLGDPAARMKSLLDSFSQNQTPFNDLNGFYAVILKNAVDCDDEEIVDCYQVVLGTIVLIENPLPVTALALLIGRNTKQISTVLRNLQSVILLGSGDVPLIYHKSFPDYVTDPARCKDINLWIDPTIHHTRIATHCFIIMDGLLRYNILWLEGPARFMENKDGQAYQGISDGQLQEKIPSELRYACIYWADHLKRANIEDSRLMKELENFVDVHMLHWFEVLSLIGKLDLVPRCIRVALGVVERTSSDLCQLLSDGRRFISKFYQIINQSALHIYCSALPFTPTQSLLHRRYSKEAVGTIVIGGPDQWDALIATPTHGYPEPRVKFSPKSSKFVSWDVHDVVDSWDDHDAVSSGDYHDTVTSGDDYDPDASGPGDGYGAHTVASGDDYDVDASGDDHNMDASWGDHDADVSWHVYGMFSQGMVKFWDAETGTPVSTQSFKSKHIAIANDFSIVASAMDDDITTLYNMKSRTPIATFAASTIIQHLSFSSESSRVYALLSDGTVRLWDSGNGKLISSFRIGGSDHRKVIVTLSPTGSRITFMPKDGEFIQLRNGITGALISNHNNLSEVHCEPVFSHNSSRFSVLTMNSLRLYESQSGDLVGEPVEVGNPESLSPWYKPELAISENGSLLATWRGDKVELWRENGGDTLTLVNALDIGFLIALTFSQNGMLAIATDSKVTVYNVRNCSAISVLPIISALPIVSASILTFSPEPDCARLAIVGGNVIHLWDVQSLPPSKQPGRRIARLSFSQDCTRLACMFEDGGIELWEIGVTGLKTLLYTGQESIHDDQLEDWSVISVRFSPDGRFAAYPTNKTIRLWDSEGRASIRSIECLTGVKEVALSNRMLAAACCDNIVLWDVRTLQLIDTFEQQNWQRLSFSDNGALLALYRTSVTWGNYLVVWDIVKRTVIVTCELGHFTEDFDSGSPIDMMAFLPDNSQLVVQFADRGFSSLNLVSEEVTHGPAFNHLVQLNCFPLWHGIPVWLDRDESHLYHRLVGLFPQHEYPVPMLSLPTGLRIVAFAQGSSMIALACDDGEVIFVQPPSGTPE